MKAPQLIWSQLGSLKSQHFVFGLDCIRTAAGEDTVSISARPLGHFLVATCQLQGSYTPKQTLIYRLIYFNWTIIYKRTSH